MRHNCMHKSSNVLFPIIFLVLLRFFAWKRLASDTNFGSCRHFVCNMFPVLSRRTCQTLRRVTFVADVARTNPLIQNFVSFEILSPFQESWLAQSCWGWWHWNSIAPMSNPVFTALPIDPPKNCFLVHIPISSRKYLSNLFHVVKLVRSWHPLWTTQSIAVLSHLFFQKSDLVDLKVCKKPKNRRVECVQSKRTGLVHCPAMINQLDFFPEAWENTHTQNMSGSIQTNLCLLLPLSWWFKPYLLRRLFQSGVCATKPALHPLSTIVFSKTIMMLKKNVILFEKFQQWSSITENIPFLFRYLIGKIDDGNQHDRSCSVLCSYASCHHPCWWPSTSESLLSSENRSWFHFHHGNNVLWPWVPGPDQFWCCFE